MAVDRADEAGTPVAGRIEAHDRSAPEASPQRCGAGAEVAEDRDRASYGERLRDQDRRLDGPAETVVDRGCERIREVEERILTPAMLRIEAADPSRQLVGLDCRLKGEERLKEKVTSLLESRPGLTAEQALSMLPDAVRFTFTYNDASYASGVRADSERLRATGFELVKDARNTWTDDQYKGINSQWRDPESGQRFEVQFHTQASYEAKERTHAAYERIRSPDTSDAERGELTRYQRQICGKVAVPLGATEIRLEANDG